MRSYHLRNWQPLYVSQIQRSKARPTIRMLILLSDWQQGLQENENLPIQEPKWYRKSGLSCTILYNYHSKGCHWALLMTVCKVTLSTFTPIYYGIQKTEKEKRRMVSAKKMVQGWFSVRTIFLRFLPFWFLLWYLLCNSDRLMSLSELSKTKQVV